MTRAIHVIAFGNRHGRHAPSPSCSCSPIITYQELVEGQIVYRHREPPEWQVSPEDPQVAHQRAGETLLDWATSRSRRP
jgi:hypothetical protein